MKVTCLLFRGDYSIVHLYFIFTNKQAHVQNEPSLPDKKGIIWPMMDLLEVKGQFQDHFVHPEIL